MAGRVYRGFEDRGSESKPQWPTATFSAVAVENTLLLMGFLCHALVKVRVTDSPQTVARQKPSRPRLHAVETSLLHHVNRQMYVYACYTILAKHVQLRVLL